MGVKPIIIILMTLVSDFSHFSMEDEEVIINWINVIEKIPGSRFIMVENFVQVPNPPQTESTYWSEYFFQEWTNPHHPGIHAKHSYVCNTIDLDLLKHQYVLSANDTITI